MSEENNIKNFTAADIDKYWNGTLSAAEMHALEKAAMDDPFLADAIEGYKNINLSEAGLHALKERIDKRIGAVVPVLYLKRKRFTWLRVAAAIIIIVGVGLIVQQLVFNDQKKNAIAILEKSDKSPESVKSNDSIMPDALKDVSTQSALQSTQSEQKATGNINAIVSDTKPIVDSNNKTDNTSAVDLKKREAESIPGANAQVIANADKKNESSPDKADFGRTIPDSTKILNYNKISPSAAKAKANQAYFENDKLREVVLNNRYNYRVVDAQNNPIPFANVMNTRDNVGTYTDIRGTFNLVSSDSVLNVQVRSLGYNSANYKLVPSNVQGGDLILKEDNSKKIVLQNRKVVSSRSRKDSTEIEEPEVGWGNYNTYVQNNIQIPENVRPKNTRSDVELSFDIDKTGQPINIKVTRSSQCKECDEEAIRLLKEGPKWKRKGKKSKATVSIAVDQK